MSIDREELRRCLAGRDQVVRVVVAETQGSTPREAGTAMIVWQDGQSGTIGGGALEFQATEAARQQLAAGVSARLERMPLGPALNQCCGGAVTLLAEIWDKARLGGLDGPITARPLPGKPAEMPLAVHRALARARGQGHVASARIVQSWFIEPVAEAERQIWIWGAGHVGRAIVEVLRPLPGVKLTWLDTDESRFPVIPEGVTRMIAGNPAELVGSAPPEAEHLVLTFSHALDLELCHRLLGHGFSRLGLIGSETKWARFRSRLAALGHPAKRIGLIDCPIGQPGLGKHPQAIAIGVAAKLLEKTGASDAGTNSAGETDAHGERTECKGQSY